MRQPKSGLIKFVNKQGNRSDNDAPQHQCCFVVFMSFSGGGGLKGGLVRWVSSRLLGPGDCVSNRLGCLRGCGVMFYFLCVCRNLYVLLTIAGQMRSLVSTASDADQV